MDTLRLAGITTGSMVDGPGMRITIFTQGCPHRCEGCHNPQTWNEDGGYDMTIQDIGDQIIAAKWCNQLTFSGGEPMMQAGALLKLLEYLKYHSDKTYHIMTFTGFVWEYIISNGTADQRALLEASDIVVDGPFKLEEKSLDLTFKGSRNQRIINTKSSVMLGTVVLSKYDS